MSLRPLVAVCGTTGVGKSKLAVELALALSQPEHPARCGGYRGARIINADAMQVYAGIDILTNKVPVEEQCGVEHLLMGFKHPGEQYVVGQWVKDAMRLIDETHQRKQVPIVVGGTSYWVQHLLFPGRLATFDQPVDASPSPSASAPSPRLADALGMLSPDLLPLYQTLTAQPAAEAMDAGTALALHRLLAALDPPVAQRWHWKDTRKVLRSLELIQQTGRLPSEIISEQSQTVSPPRYRTLCFWLYARPEALNPRLDSRVDQMLEQGLLQEVAELMQASPSVREPREDSECNACAETNTSSTNYTLGIYQSIGYRGFSSYLALDPAVSHTEREKAFQTAVERMKTSTRQYAKRQVSWIRNKLLPAARDANTQSGEARQPSGDAVTTFLLDASELGDRWMTDVQQTATRITTDFLDEQPLPDPLTLSETAGQLLTIREKPTDPSAVLNARRKITCPVCTVDDRVPVMIEEGKEWKAHENTRRHRGLAARAKRLQHGGRDKATDGQVQGENPGTACA